MRQSILIISFFFCFGFIFGQDDKSNGNQRAFYECSEPMDIDLSHINLRRGELYFQFNINQVPINLKSMDFIWLKDSPKEYFTAYLVNATDSTFTAKRQDGSLIMIQEAMDDKGSWQPIEYWVYSGCGNSYFNPLQLASGKYVLIPIKKYSGNFKTKIRLKFKYGNNVLYSDSFNGSVEKSQFMKEKEKVHGILYHGPANYLDEK